MLWHRQGSPVAMGSQALGLYEFCSCHRARKGLTAMTKLRCGLRMTIAILSRWEVLDHKFSDIKTLVLRENIRAEYQRTYAQVLMSNNRPRASLRFGDEPWVVLP